MITPLDVAIQLQALGLSPLPTAPKQPADQYPALDKNGNPKRDKTGTLTPAYTGKNPSFLDTDGTPHLVHHTQYQKQQPTAADLQLWFSNPANGIGCLGGKNKRFIDFDAKNFGSEADCQARVLEEWLNQYPQLEGAQVERTQSGGFRIWIKFEQPPSFTNFCLEPGGKHIGEILGKGRFAVLAPTVGTSGTYTVIQHGGFAVVPSAESIGLHPTKTAKAKPAPKPQPLAPRIVNSSETLALDRLATSAVQAILTGRSESDDRSADTVKVAREVYGWAEWCSSNGLNYHPTPRALIERCADSLGIDGDRLTRILDGAELNGCLPACVNLSGDEAAWLKVKKLSPELWEEAAPRDIKTQSSSKPRLDIRAGQIDQAAHTVLTHFGSAADPRERIYAQGNSQGYILVRVLKTVTGIENRYLHVSKDNDVLDPVMPESLQWEINRAFEIFRWTEKDGEPVARRTDCSATLPKQILAMGRWPQLPNLRGLSYTPLLTKTGEVIKQPGYHQGTGYLLQFDPTDYSLKENPTKEDAIAGLLTLKDLLSEFCFKTDVDRSAALSLLLTAISRKLYALAPLHAVNAHQPGTGKGTLINLACILATGNKEAGAAGFTDNEEEMGKKIFATLLSGAPIVNIDNVDRRLGGGTLERVLTAEFYKDRILGVSKNAVCSTQVLWTANGNNLAFTTDMTRRTVLIELDAGMESPETRTFSRDIETYALEHRGELVSAALTVLQSYLKAGSPVPTDAAGNPINPPPLGSFGGWDAVVRRTLLWLGESDPVQSQATIRESDDGRITLSVFLEAWYSELGSSPMQVRDVVQRAIAADGDFKHAVLEVCLDRQGQPSTKILGYYLRRNAGVVVRGHRLIRGDKTMTGVPWTVEKVQPAKKNNQGEVSSSSSWGDARKAPKPIQGNDLSAYDDAKVSSYPSVDSVAKSHDDAKVSSYKPEPIQTESFSHLDQPFHDDDDDDQPRYKTKTEVIIDADDF